MPFSIRPGQTAMMVFALLLSGCAGTHREPPPDISFDGLERVQDTAFGAVYRKPGADIGGYRKYGLAPCEVAFRKDWLPDHNDERMDLSSKVTQKDVTRIKASLGKLCTEAFAEALQQPPPYALVEDFDTAERVLLLEPAIVNLDISAPDLMTPGITYNYTTSAGEMTLLLELKDATTGEVLYRIADREKDFEDTQLQWTNAVTNRADARRILKRWAGALREALDAVRTAP